MPVVTAQNCGELYARLGLDGVLCGEYLDSRGVESGPDGRTGCVIAECQGTHKIGYWPAEQVWTECASGAYWIGYSHSEKPGPDDLARADMHTGHRVLLADGNEWLIPAARMVSGGTCLPETIRLDKTGEIQTDIMPEYAALRDTAIQLWEQASETGRFGGDLGFGLDVACRALAVNYRVSKWEAGALGLLTTPLIQKIMEALVDLPTLTAWVELKKNEEPSLAA